MPDGTNDQESTKKTFEESPPATAPSSREKAKAAEKELFKGMFQIKNRAMTPDESSQE